MISELCPMSSQSMVSPRHDRPKVVLRLRILFSYMIHACKEAVLVPGDWGEGRGLFRDSDLFLISLFLLN